MFVLFACLGFGSANFCPSGLVVACLLTWAGLVGGLAFIGFGLL